MKNNNAIKWLEIIKFGYILFLSYNVVLFLLSIPFPNLKPELALTIGNLVLTLVLGLESYFFSRKLKLESLKDAYLCGAVWTGISFITLLIIGIGNKTTGLIFLNWTIYLMFAAIAAGPILYFKKNIK